MLDCVVWQDGSTWRAALDTSELHETGSGRGALADFKPLTNYALEHQYGTFR
jgi:tripeptidyl-peptidase-2